MYTEKLNLELAVVSMNDKPPKYATVHVELYNVLTMTLLQLPKARNTCQVEV